MYHTPVDRARIARTRPVHRHLRRAVPPFDSRCAPVAVPSADRSTFIETPCSRRACPAAAGQKSTCIDRRTVRPRRNPVGSPNSGDDSTPL